MFDAIVIGKGPAGLSAALYLGREGYNVIVIGKEGSLDKCNEFNNYLGIENISGPEYLKIAEKQVKNMGVDIKKEKVLKVSKVNETFNITTDISEYTTKTIILALGIKKSDIKIKNLNKYVGNGVSYCVSCDGYFYKNKNVGVVGSSEYAIEEALNLQNYTDKITIFTNGKDMKAGDKYISNLKQFNIDNRKIISFEGDNELKYVKYNDDEKIAIDGIFIANDTPNIDDLSNSLGIITKDNKIVIDENNMTNIEGIFVCGDMINNFKQVATAVGSGASSGFACIKYLIKNNIKKEN